MLEHYFGPGLLINVGDILKRDPPMQAGCTGLGQARAQSRDALRAIALMFRFIIAVLQILGKAQPQRHVL